MCHGNGTALTAPHASCNTLHSLLSYPHHIYSLLIVLPCCRRMRCSWRDVCSKHVVPCVELAAVVPNQSGIITRLVYHGLSSHFCLILSFGAASLSNNRFVVLAPQPRWSHHRLCNMERTKSIILYYLEIVDNECLRRVIYTGCQFFFIFQMRVPKTLGHNTTCSFRRVQNDGRTQ